MNSQRRTLVALLSTILCIVALTAGWLTLTDYNETATTDFAKTQSTIVLEGMVPEEEFSRVIEKQTQELTFIEAELVYPVGEIITTASRKKYKAETMQLVIPKLQLQCTVQDGTDDKTLESGPGLYEYAQLPSVNNANVSIAGHRDIHGSHFYYLDTLKDGDLVYLTYNNQIYEYQFLSSKIYAADDWTAIGCKEISCVTLTTCDPIGTSLNRLVVTAQLTGVYPYSENFDMGIS